MGVLSTVLSKALITSVPNGRRLDSDTSDTDQGGQRPQPAFITVQSLGSFAGAGVGVTVIWKGADAFLGLNDRWIPLAAAFVIGFILYLYSVLKKPRPELADAIVGLPIAFINSVYLALSALGIDIGLEETGLIDQTQGPTQAE